MNKFTIVLAVIIIGFVVLIGYMASNRPSSNIEVTASKEEILAIDEDDHVLGNPEAEFVVHEYFDFECPACAAYHPFVKQALELYGDKFAYVPRNFPLYFHLNGRNAALAVEAAGEQGKYYEMTDAVFVGQEDWSGKAKNINLFEVYAEEVGLDMEKWRADVASDYIALRVDTDTAEGAKLEVPGTPTFFLNGEMIDNPQSIEEFGEMLGVDLVEVETTDATTTQETETTVEVTASTTVGG